MNESERQFLERFCNVLSDDFEMEKLEIFQNNLENYLSMDDSSNKIFFENLLTMVKNIRNYALMDDLESTYCWQEMMKKGTLLMF